MGGGLPDATGGGCCGGRARGDAKTGPLHRSIWRSYLCGYAKVRITKRNFHSVYHLQELGMSESEHHFEYNKGVTEGELVPVCLCCVLAHVVN